MKALLYKNIKVIKKPAIFNFIPIISTYTAQAFYPFIIVPKSIYDELKTHKLSPKYQAVLEHERTHILREKSYGVFKWGLKYLFSKKFRFDEEVIAIIAAMKVYKKYGLIYDTERSAKFLSSYVYLWCCSYEKDKQELDEAWKKVSL